MVLGTPDGINAREVCVSKRVHVELAESIGMRTHSSLLYVEKLRTVLGFGRVSPKLYFFSTIQMLRKVTGLPWSCNCKGPEAPSLLRPPGVSFSKT